MPAPVPVVPTGPRFPVLERAARLVEVEVATPTPVDDADFLVGLGLRRPAGAGADPRVRTCADPYGCTLHLVAGPRPRVQRLQWQAASPGGLAAAAVRLGAVGGRPGLDAVESTPSGLQVRHPDGLRTELRWERDRDWAGGSASGCPLHDGPEDSCPARPPLIDHVDLACGAAGGRSLAELLGLRGRTVLRSGHAGEPGVAASAAGPRLVLRDGPRAPRRGAAPARTPGGLAVLLLPAHGWR
ncbi:hypothetical protein GTR02_09835 [Kineococcus sp. R8]|uniref:hypothetical protein n=1 Tax=Kineococcus siccus TaxID=2696567 RepID=UPI001413729F|nr:hypothetical protein [Kineococcus siccus]NAZ82117.1 hypothetical protein [Kineococcus siccus]